MFGGLWAGDHNELTARWRRPLLESMQPKRVRFTVDENDAGKRLDQVLAAHVPELSRTKARVLLGIGGVYVDRARVKVAGRTMKVGQTVEAVLGGAFARAVSASKKGSAGPGGDDVRIVAEDADFVVVEKPSGLLTAPTPESDQNNLFHRLLLMLKARGDRNPELFVVHRLDMETSGLLVFAKSAHGNRFLSERFRMHDIRREYLGVVLGAVPEGLSVVDSPVGGKRAVTRVEMVERFGKEAALLRFQLETGRTHQIRLHMAGTSHPVLGDRAYGQKSSFDPPRMALHAAVLGFVHPRTHEMCVFESPWPADLEAWMAELRTEAARAQ